MRDRPEWIDGTSIFLCDCKGQVAISTAWYGYKWQGYAPDGRLAWATQFTDVGAYCGGWAYMLRFGPHPRDQECSCAPLDASTMDDPAFRAAVQRGDAAALVRLLGRTSRTVVGTPYRTPRWGAPRYFGWPWEWSRVRKR